MLQFVTLRRDNGRCTLVSVSCCLLAALHTATCTGQDVRPHLERIVPAISRRPAEPDDAQILLMQSVREAEDGEGVSSEEAARRRKLIEDRVRVVESGSSTRARRDAGIAALPLQQVSPFNRVRAQQVLDKLSVFRELPAVEFEVHQDVYRYFQSHPDVAVGIWRAMEISEFAMSQTGPREYEADAGDGTLGVVEVLYRDDRHSLALCNGEFKSPLVLRPVEAKALIHVQTEHVRNAAGQNVVRHVGRVYVSFPSQTVGTAAKLISPLSNLIIDRNFREVSLFLHMMSRAMEKQPGWVEQLTGKLDGVLEEHKTELLKLTAEVYIDGRKRTLALENAGGDATAEQILAPVRSAQPVPATPASLPPRLASESRPMSQ